MKIAIFIIDNNISMKMLRIVNNISMTVLIVYKVL